MMNHRVVRMMMGLVSLAAGCSSTANAGSTEHTQCSIPTALAPSSSPHWTYKDGDEPPAAWGTLSGDELCGTGRNQTPINIVTAAATTGASRPHFAGYGKIPLVIEHNGHTIEVEYTARNDGSDPRFDFGGKTYVLVQFHLHSPSEHTVDGASHAGELHMVHKASDGSMAVVGVFLDEGAFNSELGKVIGNAPPASRTTTCANAQIDLAALVPRTGTLWSYAGSLTTPPCAEGVTWFVSGTPRTFSTAQRADFVSRTAPVTNRPIQGLNGRTINKIVQ